MEIKIKETGEIKDLTIKDSNNIEWTLDLVTAPQYWNKETEQYEMSQGDYEWWAEYIDNYENDEQEAQELADELGITLSEVQERISDALDGINDYDDHHCVKQRVFTELRGE